MILLYNRRCTSVNRVRNILKISQSANWQTREDAPQFGALAHVKEELAAGRRAWDQMREEQLNEQLRMLRVLAKRCAEKGEHVRARATISLIQEIEQEKRRRAAMRERGGPSR